MIPVVTLFVLYAGAGAVHLDISKYVTTTSDYL